MNRTNPEIDEKTTQVARLMSRIVMGAQEDLPLFTIKIWVGQMARESAALYALLDEFGDDLYTSTLSVDWQLNEEDAHWFGEGLRVHGKLGPIPDTAEGLDPENPYPDEA